MSTPDLARDLALSGTRLIEASAGTGKTWTIAGLYLRCVVERRLPVREILVVTFTRAATEELKDRLRQRLLLCADMAEAVLRAADSAAAGTDNADATFARELIERALRGGEKPEELARRLRLEAVSMDEAAIHTIHGFCQRVLREQAFASGAALDAGELIGSDGDLIEQIAADFWRLNASDAARAADFDVLLAKLGSADALARLLRQLGAADLLVWPQVDAKVGNTVDHLQASIALERLARERLLAVWSSEGERTLAAVVEHTQAKRLSGKSYRPDWNMGRIDACAPALRAGAVPGASDKLAWFGARKLAAAGTALPDLVNAFTAAVDAWLDAETALRGAQAQRWPALIVEARIHANAQLEQRKQRAARQSYDDLITRLHAAISDPAHGAQLAQALHARYPVILVDEFQDTDERQFEIFRRMHAVRDDGALFLVGDPKQAIYRFRGGDIEAYLRAAADAQPAYRLTRNFRSSPGFLKAVEAVFAQADAQTAFVDPRIRFHAVEPSGCVANDDVRVDGIPIAPLTCWHLPVGDAAPTKDAGREQLALACAEAIVQLLSKARAGTATIRDRKSGQPIVLAPRNIAVLVSTNKEATAMQDALAARGIASATIRQESVFATEDARDLHTFLAALESREEAGVRAALASRLFGFDARAIAALIDPAHADAWQAELQRLDALHRTWRQHGVLALFEHVFEVHAAAILDSAGGERRMTNYLQLADLLQRESVHQFGAAGLIEWLRRRIALADDRNEDEQLRLESDADRVQIATIHASKGLEYDLVFLPFTALSPGQPTVSPLVHEWHEHERRNAWVRARGDDDKSDALIHAIALSERQELAERVRVLYVALTRARYACWLSWDVIGRAGKVPALAQLWHGGRMPGTADEARAALQRLASTAPDVVRVEALPNPGNTRLDPVATAVLPAARRFDAHIDTSWWITSFSQLRDGQRTALADANGVDDEVGVDATQSSPATPSDAAVADWPRGDRFGTAMHEILERTDFAAWRDFVEPLPPSGERDAIRARLRRHALAPPEREAELQRVVTRMVAVTLNARLPGDVRLADLPEVARRAEMSFHFAIGDADPARLIALLREHGYQQRRVDFVRVRGHLAGLMTGVIDLVYLHDARWWIVDYKTNHLGAQRADYAPAALADAVRDHDYDLQYVIYTLALHRWLRSRLGDAYDYERDIGGAVYLFLRGLDRDGTTGVHVDRPSRALIEAMDALLAAETTR